LGFRLVFLYSGIEIIGTLWFTSFAGPGLYIQGTDRSNRQRLRVVLDASGPCFFLAATGGTAYVYVAGYSFGR
jgi:hypothetical protein